MEARDLEVTLCMDALPRDLALRLCQESRDENKGRWYRWTTWMCWGCTTFSRGDVGKMCLSSQPDNRGCVQVNARLERQREAAR